MGRPAILTVFIPPNPFEPGSTAVGNLEDQFNATQPKKDQKRWRGEIVNTLLALGNSQARADALADVLLPDILTVDLSAETAFLNGRAPANDVIDAELNLITNGAITTDCISNDSTFLSGFPYLGVPNYRARIRLRGSHCGAIPRSSDGSPWRAMTIGKLLSVLAAVAAGFVVGAYGVAYLVASRGSADSGSPSIGVVDTTRADVPDAATQIDFWSKRVADQPNAYLDLTLLGQAFARKARETSDIDYYVRAENAVRRHFESTLKTSRLRRCWPACSSQRTSSARRCDRPADRRQAQRRPGAGDRR